VSAILKKFVATVAITLTATAIGFAQTPRPDDDNQVRARQRISTMEAILARAVQNGADMVLRQASDVMPDRPMLSGAPQVRGFRLDGYGVFFHVQVPTLVLPITWPIRQLVQESENRAATMTLQRMFAEVSRLRGAEAERLQQLIRELQLQLDASSPRGRGRVTAATLAAVPASGGQPAPQGLTASDQRIVDDPHAAYTEEVKSALINAMLENSQGLAIDAKEWLVIAARDDAPQSPMLLGGTIDFSTWIMRVRGSDLAALRAGTISIADARSRVEIREE
jgi:hypothetical protein